MANNCKFYNGIVISFDVFNSEVVLYKCCYKHSENEYITRYSIEDWETCNIVEECTKYIDNFGQNHNSDIDNYCISNGAEGCCFREGNTLQMVYVYLNYNCNADCIFCKEFKERRDFLKNNLELTLKLKDLFFQTLYRLKNKGIGIELTSVGEPFFFKSDIKQFISSCSGGEFTKIRFVTNASLIDDELLGLIKNSNIAFEGTVSLNVPNEKAYREIMKLGQFEKTLNNTLKLSKVARIDASFVIDQETLKYYEEFPAVFKVLKSEGISFYIVPNAVQKYITETEEYKFIKKAAENV